MCHETQLRTHGMLGNNAYSLSRETLPLETEIFALRLCFKQLVF